MCVGKAPRSPVAVGIGDSQVSVQWVLGVIWYISVQWVLGVIWYISVQWVLRVNNSTSLCSGCWE